MIETYSTNLSLKTLCERCIMFCSKLCNDSLLSIGYTRISHAYSISIRSGAVRYRDRLIDRLVECIENEPELVSEWTDYPLLCTVAYLNMADAHNIIHVVKNKKLLRRFILSEDSNLVIFESLMKNVMKLFEINEFQDMIINMIDEDAWFMFHNARTYLTYLPECILENVYRQIIDKNEYLIKFIPKKYITRDMCINAVMKNYMSISNIPIDMIDENICKAAVYNNSLAIYEIPEVYLTEDLCMTAFELNPEIIDAIPSEFVTTDMCVNSVIYNFETYPHVRDIIGIEIDKLVESALWILASSGNTLWKIINKNPKLMMCIKDYTLIKYMMEKIKNLNEAIWVPFTCIRDDMITREVVEFAFSICTTALQYIPEKFITQSMCYKAVSHSPLMIMYVPDMYKTRKLIRMAVTNNGNALAHVPLQKRTRSLCKIALESSIESVYFIPKTIVEDIVENVITNAIKSKNIHLLSNIFLNETCQKVFTNMHYYRKCMCTCLTDKEWIEILFVSIYCIPSAYIQHLLCKNILTIELLERIVISSPSSISSIPPKLRTLRMFTEAYACYFDNGRWYREELKQCISNKKLSDND